MFVGVGSVHRVATLAHGSSRRQNPGTPLRDPLVTLLPPSPRLALAAALFAAASLSGNAKAQWLARAAPEDVGLSSAALARIQPALQAYVDSGKLAGVLAVVVRHGKVAYVQAVGRANAEKEGPLSPDALFRIYSMTTPVTAVAAMQLVDQGKLRLDDPVSKYIPAFSDARVYTGGGALHPETVPAQSPVTVEQLLTHTSGLGYILASSTSDSIWKMSHVFDPTNTIAQFADSAAHLPLIFQPGKRWSYAAGIDILGRVIEVASGQPLDVYLREHIFEPLHMRSTAFHVLPAQRAALVTAHALGADRRLHPAPPAQILTDIDPEAKLYSGGGGLVSTAEDYVRFAQMLLNGGSLDGVRILKPETVALVTRDHLAPGQVVPRIFTGVSGYGFGLGVTVQTAESSAELPSAAGSYGWSGILNTFFWIDPKNDLIGMVWAQHFPFRAYPLEQEFKRLVYASMTGR